jgi:hypothetical protein
MKKFLLAFVMLLAIGAGCSTNLDLTGNGTVEPDPIVEEDNDAPICKDTCGNGTCEEIVCMGTGCACAETEDSCPQDCSADDDDELASDLIHVTSLTDDAKVKSPLTIAGEARGNWYFEASFPVKVYDANDMLLGTGIATAQGDWMTTDFVPFTGTITFSTPTTATGTVVFEKDNPSGLPENDNSLTIPVTF